MTGRGSIRHNNRSFSAANVDRSRSGQNVTFCNEDLKKVYHELFDEALAAYNAKKKKTRDKIPDYYEHIRQSKQEKLFHEAIFQIGNLTDCGCGSPGGERAAAALKEFAESFQERNPHLRVFNMVLHMDEATPHLHVDFVPVATEQSRGLSTRVSMKQALKQQGFEGLGRKQTEWKAWMEREKEALTEIAQAHEFEIISLGGGRPHMELPEYRAAAQRLEAVQEQVIAAEQEIAALEKQRKALQGNVKLLKAVEKVKPDLDAIQPEKTLTGAVKGVTVEQVKELKAAVIRGAAAEQKVRELKVENQQLQQKIPSMKEKLKEAQERQRLENENRQLKVQVEYSGRRFEPGARDFGAAPGRDRGGAGFPGSALAGAVPAPGRKGAGAVTCARGAAAGERAGTGPHLGRYGAVKEACPGALQEPPGQAIITVKIGNKMY